ncbi:MAG: hypothetical protein ACOX2N_00020 [Peptococcia bacterium]
MGHNQNTHLANCFSTGTCLVVLQSVGGLVGYGSGVLCGRKILSR